MHRAYLIGKNEKHRIEFRVHWLAAFLSIVCDGKVIVRKPIFLKVHHAFEVGIEEKHIVSIQFHLFDYLGDFFHVSIDGRSPSAEMEIRDQTEKPDTAVEDAAAAFFFVSAINLLFSVIGTSFLPDLYALNVRLLLFVGGLTYALAAVRTLRYDPVGFGAGTVFFVLDSLCRMAHRFSMSELFLRGVILFYLIAGAQALRSQRRFEQRARV